MLDPAGARQTYEKSAVKFKIDDPMSAHFDQLGKYTDDDMHNVFAYLDTSEMRTPCASKSRNRDLALRRRSAHRAPIVDPKDCSTRPPIAGSPITATTPASGTASLTEITPENVGKLKQVWRFQTGQNQRSRRRRSW